MTDTELKSCIGTIEMLRRLHGVMNVIDADNCEKIIKVLSDIPKYKDAYSKGWEDGAKASYEHLKMCEEEQEPTGHWIEHEWKELREKGYYRCSVCNHGYQRYTKGIRKSDVPYIDGQEYTLWHIDNYCPNCGAKMIEPQERSDKE